MHFDIKIKVCNGPVLNDVNRSWWTETVNYLMRPSEDSRHEWDYEYDKFYRYQGELWRNYTTNGLIFKVISRNINTYHLTTKTFTGVTICNKLHAVLSSSLYVPVFVVQPFPEQSLMRIQVLWFDLLNWGWGYSCLVYSIRCNFTLSEAALSAFGKVMVVARQM